MAAVQQGHQVHPDGRAWKAHFPKGDLWVFGYGSLIWKPPPHYANHVNIQTSGSQATLVAMCGDSGSTDHRGTPEQPGRVVTVIERSFWETLDDPLAGQESESSSTGKVWGAAYHIPASHAEEVHDYLDEREIDGYSVQFTPFHPTSGPSKDPQENANHATPITCMVYIGQPNNPQFLRDPGQRAPRDVAEVISAGRGQSGKNTEYLYLLEKALEGLGLGTADVHVTDLVRRVRAIEAAGLAEVEEREAEQEVKDYLARSPAESAHGERIE